MLFFYDVIEHCFGVVVYNAQFDRLASRSFSFNDVKFSAVFFYITSIKINIAIRQSVFDV